MKTGVALILWLTGSVACWCQSERWTLAFWNVENFFDTKHDTLKQDYAFTPEGDNHWTYRKYGAKRDGIYKVVAAMKYPVVIGLAEVENDYVLRDLCRYTPLQRYGYDFVHFESPDSRGVDCALLYRQKSFRVFEAWPICVSDTLSGFFTRDILLVGGVFMRGDAEDSCFILVNHWPSKLNGAKAEKHRITIAKKVRGVMDSLIEAHPTASVMAMGDFNSDPYEPPMREMEFDKNGKNPEGLYNLMFRLPKGEGSYKFQNAWSYIDQIIANRDLCAEVFKPHFMVREDPRYMGEKMFRTSIGMRYVGGFSDHLPIIVRVP